MDRKIGDILEATDKTKNAGVQYIIFYDGYNDSEFIGGMLTSTDLFPQNKLMRKSYFVEKDENGNDFKVTFKNSKLVPARLLKPEEWGPFDKVGQLTNQGIAFVEKHIGHLEPEYWEEYLLK